MTGPKATLTNAEALNVARNAVHGLVFHRELGAGSETQLAEQAHAPESELRHALTLLDRLLRHWKPADAASEIAWDAPAELSDYAASAGCKGERATA